MQQPYLWRLNIDFPMKKFLLWLLILLVPFLYSVYVCAQPEKDKDCSTVCFSSEVVSVNKISETCSAYELNVSISGDCAHALSHYTVGVPCGKIESLWNSRGWAQEIGTDPTTGLAGFKIDNISGFGDGSLQHFRVKFTLCSTGESCGAELNCWQPQVAYKASTCVNYQTLQVSCTALKASLVAEDPSCSGASDGALSVVVEEGQEPFTFLWSDNAAAAGSRSGLSAGAYSVLVRDASGAEVTLEETLSEPAAIAITATPTAATCNGVADGAIDLSVSGGTGTYTFRWSNGAETADIGSLAPGQYTVTVTDEAGCSNAALFGIGTNSLINIASVQAKPDCNVSNGSIDITPGGGTAPYTFSWSNGTTSEDLRNVGAGYYTVTVTDEAGCSAQGAWFLNNNNTLILKGVPSPASCADDASGSIALTVSGGSAPYTFSWSNGSNSEDLTGLASGNYTVTVTDSKGCSVKATYTVVKNTFQVPKTVVQPSCHGDSNGSIILQDPIGGTGPFTYLWSNGATGTALTGLDAGTYSVTVTDNAGCSRTLTAIIMNPSAIGVDATVSNTECNADGHFSIDLNTSGGTAPYTFEWSHGATAEDITGLDRGTYSVIVTDSHGCSATKEIIVEGEAPGWTCLISGLSAIPLCGSAGNTLSASVADADTYSWSVQSTDGSWSVGENGASSITFTAGSENSSATFSLTIARESCTQTCTYTVSACAPQDNGGGTDPGGEDPGGEDPGNGEGGDQTCVECFSTAAKVIESTGSCHTYEMVVNTNGLCRHDLSHWTLAVPCGTVSNYWNSEGWKMVFGKDPTTGLYGLKVDDISSFGKEAATFTVGFTVCEDNSDCNLSAWDPTVAYKAGLCVSTETIGTAQGARTAEDISVYPNPFSDALRFEWYADEASVSLEIIDQYGNVVSRRTAGEAGSNYITLASSALPKGMYYYRLTLDGKTFSGKLSKR